MERRKRLNYKVKEICFVKTVQNTYKSINENQKNDLNNKNIKWNKNKYISHHNFSLSTSKLPEYYKTVQIQYKSEKNYKHSQTI